MENLCKFATINFFKKLKKNTNVEEPPIDEDDEEMTNEIPIEFASEKILPEKKIRNKRGQKQIFVQAIEEPFEEREAAKRIEKEPENDWLKTKGQLAIDIYESDNEFCVKSAIAGVNSDELDVFVDNAMLVIKGERKDPEPDIETENKKYFYQECYWGPFARQILLPDNVDSSKIKATLKKGILTVKAPKCKDKKRKISIQIEE